MGKITKSIKKRHLLLNNKFIMLIIFALLLLFSLSILFFNNAHAETSSDYEKVYVSIEIKEGDTLSSYAEKYALSPSQYDEYIDELYYINNLKNDRLYSGSYLLIPVYIFY